MKSIKLSLGSLGLCLLTFSGTPQAADRTCTGNDVSALIANTDTCSAEPSYYGITVYEMGLCPSEPDAPTTSSVTDLTACEVVFESSTGSLVEVQNGVTSTPTGTFSRPANGTYTHAYMRLGNTFLIKGEVDFGTNWAAGVITNRYCISPTATTDNETAGATGTCSGASGVTPLLVSSELVDLSGASNTNVKTETVGELTVYLLKTNQQLTDTTDTTAVTGVDAVLGLQSFPNSIVITDETTALDANITVSEGMTITINGTDAEFDSGPFQLELTVQ